MLSRKKSRYQTQKSPQQRFLLVFGMIFFLLYFILGIIVIFWKEIPIQLSSNGRLAFGLLLIGYSFLRFIRLIQKNNERDEE
ncbi:hypothetical protein [Flavobacterium sp.]|uniref:hypothetical protein n=1 Tax=Flavobacterium sp. TaxID=239 RepID=UPI00403329E9